MLTQNSRLLKNVETFKRLYRRELKDRILVNFLVQPNENAKQYFPDDQRMFTVSRTGLLNKMAYQDDFYPTNYPGYGNPYGAFLGAKLESEV